MEYDIETRCLYLNDKESCDKSGAVSFPIYQSATFAHKGVGEGTGYDYTRLQNPTREHLERIVKALENGFDATAYTSGMAAIGAVMELFKPSDHIIIESDLYGGSIRLFNNISKKNGIKFTKVDLSEENIEQHIHDNTKAVFLETPTNPMMKVTDIQKLSEALKKRNILLIVDNTFLSPYFQNPLELGADIVIHSGTKFLGGHNDAIAGFVITANEELSERMRFIIKTTGAGLAPFDSWLILRGIKTLAIRMQRAEENAFKIARWLLNQNNVTKVIYPGLPEHKGYNIMKKQSRGFGSMITFEVDSKDFAFEILKNVRLIKFAESLGGVETLITYPITQTHADVPPDELKKNGITDRLLRISTGIESSSDLIKELERVFKIAKETLNK